MKKHLLAMLLAVMVLCTIVLAVPAQAAETDITLLYDDRKELSSLVDAEGEVSVSNEMVTSYKVGTTTKDDHVLVYQDGVLYAVGTGTATLTVGDKSYNVTVKPAPISLFMITGHSIGAGQEGTGTQSVVVEAGQAYSSYHQNSLDVTQVDGYGLGWGSENRAGVSGVMRWDSYGQLDAFASGEGGNTGAGSGFAYRWNQVTGEKVWVINIAIGGSCINEWLPGSQGHNTAYDLNYYDQTISKFTYAQTILKNEVAAGHYTLSKQGILNFPGYNFSWYNNWSTESLQEDYEILWNAYEAELTKVDIDGDGTADGLDIMSFTVGWPSGSNLYDRPAAWYMGSNEDYPMVLISAGTLSWHADISTFPQIDYITQSVAVNMPESRKHTAQGGTSDNSLLCEADNTHYSQVGYNAIGLEMGANLAAYFAGGAPAVTELRLEDMNAKDVGNAQNMVVGESIQLTPVVKPYYVDNLTYEVTGTAEITYPLMIKATAEGTATLTVKQGDTVLRTVNFTISAAHTHCECGGKHSGSEFHTCSESLTYVPLNRDQFTNYRYDAYNSSAGKLVSTGESYALRSGNYFLEADYTMSSSICVAPGATVNLCLNGHKLTVSARAFKPNGNLIICDCSEHGTGEVYANTTNAAPILYSYSGAKVNFYGGTFSAAEAPKREFAGCIGVANDMGLYDVDANGDGKHTDTDKLTAEVNFYGGKFIGTDLNCADGSPSTGGSGACIYVVNSKSTLNIYGGEFVGARPVPVEDGGTAAGGVIGSKGTVNIYGGIFRDSECSQGAIWTNNSNLTISGSPVFINNNNADVFLHYCDHMYIGEGGVSVDTPIRVTGSADNWTKIHLTREEDAAAFVGVHGVTMGQPDSSLIMKFARDNSYCECGGTISDEVKSLGGHVCADKTWLTLNQGNLTTRFTTDSTTPGQTSTARYYLRSTEVWLYLSGDVNLTNEIEISDGYTLHIDLNGYTITHSSGSASMFRVYGNLTICDSYGGGEAIGVRIGTSSAEAACVYALNYNSSGEILGAPNFDLYSGTLTGFNITSNTDRTRVIANQAGVVQVGNNAGNKEAVFNMYGGTITGGLAKIAGNLYIGHGSFHMYDGLITGGEATGTYGGNMRALTNNTIEILGGTFENGTAAEKGGNIYIDSCAVTIRDALIKGGSALHGGNLFITGATTVANVSDTKLVSGTASGDCGGNVYASGAALNMEKCTLEIGWAKNWGGSIYVTGKAQVELKDCTLRGGCGREGGNVYVYGNASGSNGSKLTVNGGTIEGGKAGFVYTRNEDGTITAENLGTTSGNAGNLYVGEYCSAELNNVTMTDGVSVGKAGSNGFGGNIYNKGTLKMDGCTVSGGVGFRGGVVGIRDNGGQGASYTELKNCTFLNNTASVAGSSIGLWANTNGAEVLIENCTFDDSMNSTRNGVISITAQNCTNPVTVTVKNVEIQNNNTDDADSYGIYMDYGTAVLAGNVQINADDADIYMIYDSMITADDLTVENPLTIFADRIGQIGTSATDKSASFTSETQGVTWSEGVLYINGLLGGAEGIYKTFAEAFAANETSLTLLSDHEGSAELSGDLYLNLNGMTLTGDITGTGTLYGMDSATDSYTTDNMGAIVGTVSCEVASNFKNAATLKRYMAIADAEGYTFHRFYMGITHVNLRPGVDGVGYKAVFYGDEQVQQQVTGYGFTLQLGEGGKAVSKGTEGSFVSGETVTMRLQNFDVASYGETKLYGNVYLQLADGSTVESSRCGYTLRELAETIALNANAFEATQLTAVRDMLLRYADTTSKWDVDAILNYEA